MDDDTLTYIGPRRETGMTDVHRRYRFRFGTADVDAVVPEAAAKVWFQTHANAGEEDLEQWAEREGRRLLEAQLGADPLNLADVVLQRDVDEDRERPPYGEEPTPYR
ncbi:MAG: hypothetical protein U0237_15085 [Thermoleophilia bacterium]